MKPRLLPSLLCLEDLYNRGIAGGCGASPLVYCPNDSVNRGQTAAFLVNTFF